MALDWSPTSRSRLLLATLTLMCLQLAANGEAEIGEVSLRTLEAEAQATSIAQSTDGGSSESSATAVSTGGKVEVESKAISESQSELKTDIAEAVATAVATVKNGGDATSEATAVAEEIGEATAKAIAEATVKVSVEGPGFASGSAESSSRAIAKITVTAIAEAFATATGSSEASSKARAEVSESDVAEAAASAVAKAESTGGTAISSQRTVATAVAQVIARAVASALATVSGDKSTATTDASAEADKGPGRADVTSESQTITSPSSSEGCNRIAGADYSGGGVINDGKTDITGSDEECCQLCAQYSNCRTWTRISRDTELNKAGECWLRKTVNSRVYTDYTNSGVRKGGSPSSQKTSGGSSCGVIYNIDLPGTGVINDGSVELTGSDAECCALCDKSSDCKTWTRIKSDSRYNKAGECWMRSTVNSKKSADQTNSGIKSGGTSATASGTGDAFTGR